MKPTILHVGARADLREGVDFYDSQSEGLGMEFSEEVFAALDQITARPHAFPEHSRGDVQVCLLGRFPYSIVFRNTDDAVWILAIAHHSRDESYWIRRKPTNGPPTDTSIRTLP